MINLVYPTLNLFVYHLREGRSLDAEKSQQFYKSLLESLPQKITDSLGDKTLDIEGEYSQFLDSGSSEKSWLKFSGDVLEERVEGSYHRFCIDENYGLVFEVAFDGTFKGQEWVRYLERVSSLVPNLSIVPEKLGQTWMLSACVENGDKNELYSLASQGYKALIDLGWQYQESGQFLGGTVLEFWRSSPQRWETMETDSHLMMILYPNQKAMKTGAEFYEYWKALFCYRNKIVWAYSQSREVKERMFGEFNQMSSSIENIYNLDLAELRSALQKNAVMLSNFVNNINYLEIQQHAIDVNLHNYDKYLESIEKKAGNVFHVSNDLKFLHEFSDMVKAKYQKQIEKDYASLRPCLDVLQNLIGTIGGIVKILQAQSDRDFQTFVGVAGVGIGAAGAIAASSSSWIAQVKHSPTIASIIAGLHIPEPWTNLAIALTFSSIAGVLGCLVGFMFVNRFRLNRIPYKSDR